MLKQKKLQLAALVGLIIVAIALTVSAYNRSHPSQAGKTPTTSFLPKASESASPVDAAGNSPQPGASSKPLPVSNQPATSSSGLITITSPTSGASVSDGSTVTGKAHLSDGKLYFRLKGTSSGQLASGVIQVAGSTTQAASYSFALGLTNQVCGPNKACGPGATDTGVLEVYSVSPQNGSEINQASVPVEIKG